MIHLVQYIKEGLFDTGKNITDTHEIEKNLFNDMTSDWWKKYMKVYNAADTDVITWGLDGLVKEIDIDKEVENINDLIEEIKQSEVDNYPIKVEYDDIEKFNQIFKELDQGMRESAYDLDTTIKQIHFMLIAGRITESQEKELAEYIKKLY